MLRKLDFSYVRKLLCDDDSSPNSVKKLLDLRFIPIAIVERWRLAEGIDEIASAVEEVSRFYMHLNSYQRLDAKDDVPIVVVQMLSTMSSFSDVTVLSVCLRFLSVLFEDHSDAFTLSVDLILVKLLKYLDDQRLAMRSAAVRCIGVFLSKVPFSSLEGHIFMILHTKEANLDQQFYSDSRLKLVTLAILRLSWEIGRDEQIGTFCLGTSYLMTITGLARAIVTDMFELPTATPRNCVGMSGERTEKSHRQHSERAISSSLDLLAATFLVLYPSKLRNKDSLLRNSFTKKSLLSEFIENVLTDGSGVVRVGSIMQEEIYKRATDRCLVSLNSDSNLSSIADSLLIVDDDKMNSPQSFSRSRQTPLSLAVPSSETIDSLHTTGETSMTVSMGSVHSTSSLIFSPTNSNSNTPLSPMSHNNNDGNESTDGVDSDMDRSKLSTLKRNKNRNVPRRQTYGGALGVEVARPTTPDFFVTTDRSASVREAAIGGSLSHGNSRSKAEFSKLLAQRASQSKVVGEANRIHCRAAVVRDKIFGTDEFSEVHVTPNHTSSFLRPNRPDVDALDEDDVVVSDADEFDEEIEMHIGFDVDSGDDASTVHEVNDNPDLLAFTGVSFMQGLGARTAEERTRSHKQPYSNHSSGRTERSKSVQCPQTPVAVAIYGADGQRTQELVVQCHTSERTSKRAVVGLGAPRGVRALGVSSSLPGHVSPSLSGDSLESSSTYGCPIVVRESRVADLPSLRFSTHNGRDRDRDRDRNDPSGNISNESVSMTGFSNTRKMRVMHSPRSTTSTVVSASASSSSSRCSSPKGSNKTAVTTNGSGGKVELKNRNRVRVTRDHDDDSQNQSHEQRHEQESKSGLKEYQLAGETFEYLSTDSILPCASPSKDLTKAMQAVGLQEWPEIFHTLTTIRRLGLHHSALLTGSSNNSTNNNNNNSSAGGGLHCIVLGVLKQVDNLRSAVAKNALITLGDLFQGLGKSMDLEVALALTYVLKRFADSSSFLVDSAERALQQMMDGVTPSRSLAGLLTAAEHKTAFVRGKVASLLYLLLCQKLRELRISFAAGGKELDGLKARISKLVHDQTPEARTASRNIVRFLVKEGIVSKWEWCQHIPADQLDKILLQALTPPIAMSTGNQDANSSAHESPSNRRSSNPVITKQRILAQGRSSLNSSASFLPPQPKQTLSVNTPILEDLGKVDAAEGFVSESDVDGRAFNANNKKAINLYASNSSGSVKLPASNCLNSSGQFASKHNSLRRRDSNALVAKRAMDGPDLVGVPELTHTISTSSSSIERQDAIKSLTSLIISHWQVMLDAGKLGIYLDCLLERLEDGSVKVVHCTLTCLQRIQDDAPGALSPSPALQIVVTSALHVAASSSNRQIASNAVSLLSLFVSSMSVQTLIPHLCSICLHEKERQRAVAFRVIGDLLVSGTTLQREEILLGGFIKKNIFPTICQVLFGAGSKGEVRVAAAETLRALQQVLMPGILISDRKKESEKSENRDKILWTWCKEVTQQEEIRRLTSMSQ